MGLQQRMIDTMMAQQSAEDTREMMRELMPSMIRKVGPEGVASMMREMIPRMMERLDPESMERMLEDVMPDMMDSGFSRLDPGQRESLLALWRGMLDRVEEKYLKAARS